MKNTIVIYPQDPSTSFLLDSFSYLQKHQNESVTTYKILPNDESHTKCLNLISEYRNIVFMGHGSHVKLSGAAGNDFSKPDFLTINVIQNFGCKNWLLFSCKSADLIKKCTFISGIGFGDLPTDFNDVQGAREFNMNAYPGITQPIIDSFKNSINWIINKTVVTFVGENLSFHELYCRMKIIITKRMVDNIKDPSNESERMVSNLLFDMKNELLFTSL